MVRTTPAPDDWPPPSDIVPDDDRFPWSSTAAGHCEDAGAAAPVGAQAPPAESLDTQNVSKFPMGSEAMSSPVPRSLGADPHLMQRLKASIFPKGQPAQTRTRVAAAAPSTRAYEVRSPFTSLAAVYIRSHIDA